MVGRALAEVWAVARAPVDPAAACGSPGEVRAAAVGPVADLAVGELAEHLAAQGGTAEV